MPPSSSSTSQPQLEKSSTNTRTPPPSSNSNLARIRDNQRRSRARRKEYLNELEDKFRKCEQLGVEATSEMQVAARKVLEENNRLRAFLREKGISDDELDAWMDNAESGSRVGSVVAGMYGGSNRAVESPAPELASMIGTRRRCCPGDDDDDEGKEERKPSLSALAPKLGRTPQPGSVSGTLGNHTPTSTPPQLLPRPIAAQNRTPTQPAVSQFQTSTALGSAQQQHEFGNTTQDLHLPNYDAYQTQLSQFQRYLHHQQQQHQQQHHQQQPSMPQQIQPRMQSYPSQQYQTQAQLAPMQQQQQQQHQHSYNHLQRVTSPTNVHNNNNGMPTEYYNLPASDETIPPMEYYNSPLPSIDPNLNFDTSLDMDTTSSLLIPSDMQAQFLRGLSGSGVNRSDSNSHNTSYQ